MVVLRIAVLCGLGAALGGCLSPAETAPAYSALSYADPSPKVVWDQASLATVEPGQLLRSDLGRTGSGTDPIANLSASERTRTAWGAQHPSELALPLWPSARSVDVVKSSKASDPLSTASVSKPARDGGRRGVDPRSYDREAAMDRLEKEARQDAKPICSGC